MGKTSLNFSGQDFLINGKPIYSEIPGSGDAKGLMMNARFIQGVFDDKVDRRRWDRYGKIFDPDQNTDDLIAALPEWYRHGLRAFTVGLQGGWPVFTTHVSTIDNNPFGEDGTSFSDEYGQRLDRVIKAADSLGMVVIVNILYWAQTRRLKDGRAIVSAVRNAAAFLRNCRYTNVIIDLANEYNIEPWNDHLLVKSPESMQLLIDIVRQESGGLMVGSSGGGGDINQEVARASDVVLVHGNGLTRGEYYDFIRKVKSLALDKPILCNEDSPCVSRLEIARDTHTSWGHYDNFTKQEPPCDWWITPGQDTFFARRMAQSVGIALPELSFEEQFYLQGLEENTAWQGKRWIRLAAEYPEAVNYVDFHCNGRFVYRSYDEPFFLFRETTWIQKEWNVTGDEEWTADIMLCDGRQVTKSGSVRKG